MAEAICPNGHLSDTSDYCDQCGAKIGGDPIAPALAAAGPPAAPATSPGETPSPSPAAAPVAPAEATSGTPAPERSSSPFSTPAVASGRAFAAPSWEAVVVADRDYYDRMQTEEIPFPAVYPDRVFTLTKLRAVIGRRSASRGIKPEIDLSGAPEDPGVSHMHAVLVGSPEGGWTLIDPGSANGTFLNDSPDPIDTNKAVPVADGDRIHMGAWTTLTLRKT